MRNLKKVLSLVLCVAVMLSVMVMGAGAAFSDQDKIENTEAVDACSALNILVGYEDGSFHPERNIKRSEVTKMICVALNGGKEPNVSSNAKPTFKDVRGTIHAWAEGYIESCVAQGIVDGVGGDRFAPAGNVTGAQLAKMLLVSLGYKAENEGFTGNAWETNVNVRATQKHLYDGLEKMDTSAAVTRDQASQMVWNAMQAYEVEYKTNIVTDANGNLVTQIVVQDKVVGDSKDKITLLRDKYNAWGYVGTLTNVDGTNITISMNASDCDASDPKVDPAVTSKSFSKVGADYTDLMGQKVKVLFKDGKTNEVIGVYATGDNTVYNTRLNQTERDGDKIKFDGKSYNVDDANKIKTIIDGANAVDKSLDFFDATAANKVSMNTVSFVDTDENGKIDTAVVTTYTGAEVTYVGSDKITAGGKSYNMADENIDDTLEKDDYAVISENLYDSCKDIVKATVITGELTSYKEKDDYVQYQLDGAWYNMKEEDTDVTTGDNVKAYVFNGVVLDLDTDSGTGSFPGNIVVVTGVASKDDTLNGDQIKVRYFDGTSKTVTLDDDVDFKPVVGVAYKSSGSDSAFKIEKLENKKYNGYQAQIYDVEGTLNNDKKQDADPSNDMIGKLKVSDDAAIILFDNNGRSKQITGKQFNAMVNTDANLGDNGVDHVYASFTKESNGLTRVMMASVLVKSTSITGQSSDNYGYIVTEGARTPSGDTKYTIWTGSENVTVTEDTSYTRGDRAKGTLIGYSSITNGTINDVTKYGTVKDATEVINNDKPLDTKTLYRAGNEAKSATTYIAVKGKQFNVTADTTVLLVDSKEDNDNEIGLKYTYKDKLPQAEEIKENNWRVNAFWLMDEDGTDDVDIEVLVIDSTGVFDGMDDPSTDDNGSTDTTGEAKVTNPKVNSSNKLEATVSITRPDYVPESATVPVHFDVYVDGYNMGSETADVLENKNGLYYVSKVNYPTSGTLEIKDVKMGTASEVKVLYKDAAGKDVTNKLKDGYTKTLTTGASGGDIKFTVKTTDSTNNRLQYTVTGTTADVTTPQNITDATTEQTISSKQAAGIKAVVVTITGWENLVEKKSVTVATGWENASKKIADVTGGADLTDKDKTVKLSKPSAKVDFTETSKNVDVEITVGSATTNALEFTLSTGDKIIVKKGATTGSKIIAFTDSAELSITSVKELAAPTIVKVELTDTSGNPITKYAVGDKIVITFSEAMDNATTVANLVSITGGTVATLSSATWSEGNTVLTLVTATNVLVKNDVIKIGGQNTDDLKSAATDMNAVSKSYTVGEAGTPLVEKNA